MLQHSQPIPNIANKPAKTSTSKPSIKNLEERLNHEEGRTITNESIVLRDACLDDPTLKLKPIDFKFAEYLKVLQTITENYAYLPLEQIFNWDEVANQFDLDEEGDWYQVCFRSVRKPEANTKLLYDADLAAHNEAKECGGLLKYWYGDLNEHRECFATCIWSSREFSRIATRKPLHRKAVALTAQMYETYTLECYNIKKKRGEKYLTLERLVSHHPNAVGQNPHVGH
jgi:hypothetical protein